MNQLCFCPADNLPISSVVSLDLWFIDSVQKVGNLHLMKLTIFQSLFGIFFLTAVQSIDASIISLNFDSLPAVDLLAGTPVSSGSQLHDQFLSTYGVSFSSASQSDYVAVVRLGAGATSGANGIGSVDDAGQVRYTVPLEIAFFDPANPSTLATTDFISIKGDNDATNPGTFILLTAFDQHGNEIGSQYALDGGGTTLSLSIPGIHSVVLTQTIQPGDNVAFDDLIFNKPVAIPEASSLVLISFIVLGAVLVRSRTSNARAAAPDNRVLRTSR